MPNGTLGCYIKERATPNGGASPHGIEIRKDGNGKKAANGRNGALTADGGGGKESSPPLTNSIQEKFRGFTYSGDDAGSLISKAIGKLQEEAEDVVDDEEVPEPTTEDEVEDAEAPAGRYAKQRRRKADNGVEDDF
jgi:hypothetical protein